MNGRSAFNASPFLGFLPFLTGRWRWCSPWHPLSPRQCREFTPNPADPGIFPKLGFAASCASVPIGRRLHAGETGMQQGADPKLLGVLSCSPLPPARCFLLGRCWIAQVCGAGSRCSVGIGVARSLSGASPGDTAGPGRRLTFTRGAQQKALGHKIWGMGGWWKLFRWWCPAPLTASVCEWCSLPGRRERIVAGLVRCGGGCALGCDSAGFGTSQAFTKLLWNSPVQSHSSWAHRLTYWWWLWGGETVFKYIGMSPVHGKTTDLS